MAHNVLFVNRSPNICTQSRNKTITKYSCRLGMLCKVVEYLYLLT